MSLPPASHSLPEQSVQCFRAITGTAPKHRLLEPDSPHQTADNRTAP